MLSLALAACDVVVGGPPLVSAQSPAAAGADRAMPQSVGSLPAGAEGIGRSPNATQPNELSITFRPGPI